MRIRNPAFLILVFQLPDMDIHSLFFVNFMFVFPWPTRNFNITIFVLPSSSLVSGGSSVIDLLGFI
jgi:hypothetical protein